MAELLSTMAEATLIGGMSIKLEAIDPTTGNAVTGVTVSNVAIYCEQPVADVLVTTPGGTPAIPAFVPLPNDLLNESP